MKFNSCCHTVCNKCFDETRGCYICKSAKIFKIDYEKERNLFLENFIDTLSTKFYEHIKSIKDIKNKFENSSRGETETNNRFSLTTNNSINTTNNTQKSNFSLKNLSSLKFNEISCINNNPNHQESGNKLAQKIKIIKENYLLKAFNDSDTKLKQNNLAISNSDFSNDNANIFEQSSSFANIKNEEPYYSVESIDNIDDILPMEIIENSSLQIISLEGHYGNISALEKFDNQTLISGDSKGEIRVWNLKEFACIKKFSKAHTNKINSIKNINNAVFASSSFDENLKFWDIERETCLKAIISNYENRILRGLLCKIDEDILLMGNVKGFILFFDIKNYNQIQKDILAFSDKDILAMVKLDLNKIAVSADRSPIKIYDIETCNIVKEIQADEWGATCLLKNSINTLLSFDSNGKVMIWDLKTYTSKIFPKNMVMMSEFFLYKNKFFLAKTFEKTLNIIDYETGKLKKKIFSAPEFINVVKVLNKELLALAYSQNIILLYNFD